MLCSREPTSQLALGSLGLMCPAPSLAVFCQILQRKLLRAEGTTLLSAECSFKPELSTNTRAICEERARSGLSIYMRTPCVLCIAVSYKHRLMHVCGATACTMQLVHALLRQLHRAVQCR